MKTIALFLSAMCISCFCYSQSEWKRMSDSLGLESRVKADCVLSKIDTDSGRKILYSLQDRDYLILLKRDSCYREYVLRVDDSCNVLTIKEIDREATIKELKAKRYLSRSKRKLLKSLLDDEQTIADAFDTHQYNTFFITSMPDATWVAGVPSYFVMKDEENNRYGEYCLSSITTPCPINPALWAFLFRELSDNM